MSGGSSAGPGRRTLLFVCTGNTCRSPMAEALARRAVTAGELDDVEIVSAGTFAGHGHPASEGARRAGRRHSLDLSGHRSRPVDADLVARADVIVAMTEAHLRVVRDLDGGDRAVLATALLPEDHPAHGAPVPDPVGGPDAGYEEVYRLLEVAVERLVDTLGTGSAGEGVGGR